MGGIREEKLKRRKWGEISSNHTVYMHEVIKYLKAYQKITMKYHMAVTIIIALRLTV